MGPSVRRLYEQGKDVNGAGINASFAVHQVTAPPPLCDAFIRVLHAALLIEGTLNVIL